MKIYTQKELLSEGIWGGLKSAAKGVGKGLWNATKTAAKLGDYALSKAAPEVRSLYRDPLRAAGEAYRAIKKPVTTDRIFGSGLYDDKVKKVTPAIIQSIKAGLQRNGNMLTFEPITYASYDPNSKKHIYKTKIKDSTGIQKYVYVDQQGTVLTP